MKVKLGGKLLIAAVVAGAVVFGGKLAMDAGYFKQKPVIAAAVPPKIDLPTTKIDPPGVTAQANTVKTAAPTSSSWSKTPNSFNVQVLAWNATAGLSYANGGIQTASGSLMEKNGVTMTIERQDDYSQMIASMALFAKEYKDGVEFPHQGSAMVVIMGDAFPNFAVGLNDALSKYGQAGEAIASIGFSRGEDKCMLPAEVATNPQKARGSLIGAVLRDGDAHICFKWASDNDIPINPDEKTYDPDAMNFVAVDAFTDADAKLIAGYCEDRPVVKGGKRTNETRHVCQNGTATWTPGDVKVAREKGGLQPVASTREYSYQMPALVIVNKQWAAAHRDLVKSFLLATLKGGETIRDNDAELLKAAAVEAAVYKEEDAAYWAKYFQGVVENDRTGTPISLGGSTTIGLNDNGFYFGLNGSNARDIFKSVYNVYGGIDKTYYPTELPVILPYESVVNLSYVKDLLDQKGNVSAEAVKPTFSQTAPIKAVVARRSWNIPFETGKSTFSPDAAAVLEDLLNQVAVTSLTVQIAGHTDNVGNSQANLELSKARAEAVKSWLIANSPSDFPAARIRARGYGDTQPVADNKTPEGRAKNRRVDIALVATE